MTSDGIHSYSYDAEGNLLTVDNGGTATYVYDALNRRVGVKTASSAHEYSFDYAGRRVSSWLLNQAGYPQGVGDEGRIYWDGQQIAYRALDGSTYFDHQDYLGTERLRTNHAGAAVATFATLPWGDGGTTTFGGSGADQDNSSFAGLDFDQESGSDHAQFRNYSTAQGRWFAPDPYDGSYDVTNPQSFNRYAYAGNNPLSFIDPSGLEFSVGPGGGGASCANNPICVAEGGGTGGGGGGPWADPWGGPSSLLDSYGGYGDEFDLLNAVFSSILFKPLYGVEGNIIEYDPVLTDFPVLLLAEGPGSGSGGAPNNGTQKPPQPKPAPTKPESGYSCAADGAAALAAGTVFAVIGVMSAGTVPVIVGAAWGGIALWGGTGAALWALGHAVECGF